MPQSSRFITGFMAKALASLVFLPALLPQAVGAQWVQSISAQPPATPKIFALAAKGGHVFAGFESGAFRTSDRGGSWSAVNEGLGVFPIVFSLATDGSILFSGSVGGGVFQSADNGAAWTWSGLPGAYVTSLDVRDRMLIAATCCDGLHVSPDLGATWRKTELGDSYIGHAALSGKAILAAASDGLSRSMDSGSTWTRITVVGPALDSSIGPFLRKGGALFAGTRHGLYRSQDDGLTWARAGASILPVRTLAEGGGRLIAGMGSGVFISYDQGGTWSRLDSGLADPGRVQCLAVSGEELYGGISGDGIWKRSLPQMATGFSASPRTYPSNSSERGKGPGEELRFDALGKAGAFTPGAFTPGAGRIRSNSRAAFRIPR